MEKKNIIAYINAETEYQNVVFEQALEYEHMGADGLYIYNYDNDDKAQLDFLTTVRLILKRVDISVYVGVVVKKFEDIKKALYTGAEAVVINYDSLFNEDVLKKGVERFGKEHIALCFDFSLGHDDMPEIDDETVNRLSEFGAGTVFAKHVSLTRHSIGILDKLEAKLVVRDSLVRNDIMSLLEIDKVYGVATNYYRGKDILAVKQTLKENGINVKTLESSVPFSEFKKDSNGLVPVVVQDYKSSEVLMVAYMNEDSYNMTIKTGRMTYYSRSRQELWIKGETSGHYQFVKELLIDCDKDTILAKVHQLGAACHTGNYSCFYTELAKKEYSDLNPLNILTEDYNLILDRKVNPKDGSYTNYLFKEGIDKILKKCGEEATEIIIAAKNPDSEELKYEIADFLYHLMVLMAECDLDWNDIVKELANRRK